MVSIIGTIYRLSVIGFELNIGIVRSVERLRKGDMKMEDIEELISDLKSISENETYADMKQAILDLINELEEMQPDWDLIQIN